MSIRYCVVGTKKGFIALLGEDGLLTDSTLPHPTRDAALVKIDAGLKQAIKEDIAAFGNLPKRLASYFDGDHVDFSDVPVDTSDYPPFHRQVILACQSMSYGEVLTYGDLAQLSGSPRAGRAVGNAMARNRTPLIVPCHRVVASGGRIGGFGLGLDWKRELLELEGVSI